MVPAQPWLTRIKGRQTSWFCCVITVSYALLLTTRSTDFINTQPFPDLFLLLFFLLTTDDIVLSFKVVSIQYYTIILSICVLKVCDDTLLLQQAVWEAATICPCPCDLHL